MTMSEMTTPKMAVTVTTVMAMPAVAMTAGESLTSR